jgi:hypothetical protein
VETVLSNIATLNGSLDTQKESEQFVLRYFPQQRDQSRVIDAFNFIAAQSGVLIEGMELTEAAKPTVQAPIAPSEALGTGGASALGLDGSLLPVEAPIAKTYTAKVSVRGGYENIKSFFDRVAHMDRFYKLRSFGISIDDELSANGQKPEGASPGTLIGTFQADFDYLLPRLAGTALNIPIFQHQKLDFSLVDRVLGKVTDTVPMLENPQTGKPNPFSK